MLAIYIGLAWNGSAIISSANVPFGHVDVLPVNPSARLAVTALFYGFGGVCSASALSVNATGFTPPNGTTVTVVRSPYYCNVTWDTVDVTAVATSGPTVSVTLTMNGGQAAFIGYSLQLDPHYLRGVRARDTDNSTNIWINAFNGTIVPARGTFKGAAPTVVSAGFEYAQFNDTTINAPISYQSGWLLGEVVAVPGALVTNNASFVSAANLVAVSFALTRSNTYFRVLVQPSGTFGVLLGSIFAYAFTGRF